MTEEDRVKAAAIVESWYWQPAEGHFYRYKGAQKSYTRFCETVELQTDVLKIVIEYLRTQSEATITVAGKVLDVESGWIGKDAWIQTAASERFKGTESTKIRIFQTLVLCPTSTDGIEGPFVIQDDKTYKVEHEMYWDRDTIPDVTTATDGVIYEIKGIAFDREIGKWNYTLEKRTETEVDKSVISVKVTKRGTYKKIVNKNKAPSVENNVEPDPTANVGCGKEREVTQGDRRTITEETFISAAASGNIKLQGEHELTATEHRDRTREILQDGSQEGEEPELLVIEETTSDITPIPLDDNNQPKGYGGAGDQAGGTGRKLTIKQIVEDETTGQKDRIVTARTSIPYKKILNWNDENSQHQMIVFRNLEEVPNIPSQISVGNSAYTVTSSSPSISINEFGLFDGIINVTANTNNGGAPGETSYNKSFTQRIEERYTRAGGRKYKRVYTVTKHILHGSASQAVNAVSMETGTDAPRDYPWLGLRAWCQTSGQRGTAIWYGNDLSVESDKQENGGSNTQGNS